jgi:CPA1 family monovalent cation:H+ antiporter
MTSESIVILVELFVLMLTVAVIVGVSARKLRLPYTVGLVLVGTVFLLSASYLRAFESVPFLATLLGLLDEVVELEDAVTREVILGLLVPPLIFEAAFHLRYKDLRRDLGSILLFAVPGVIITTLLVGWAITLGTQIPFATAAVFGALIAATDPVAVVALFRTMGVPKRLQVLMEGESLLNDGTAIVLFGLTFALARGGGTFNFPNAVLDFVIVAGGGLIIGLGLGWIISQIIHRLDDYLIETALTFILAYGAYFIAENIHVSGVLAVVAAGMVNGNIGPRAMSPTTRIVVANFWEFTAFIANSLVFLLIGLVVDPLILIQNWAPILIAIVAVLAARAIVIFGFSALTQEIPFRWQIILHWGGLRGAISLALALGLGANSQLRALAYGVVFFTLLIQGTTMGSLVRWLGLAVRSESKEAFNLIQARAIATQSAYSRLETLWETDLISEHTWKIIGPILQDHNREMKADVQAILDRDPEVAREELDNAWREVLRTQRSTLNNLYADGLIKDTHLEELVSSIDAALTRYKIPWTDLPGLKNGLALTDEQTEADLVSVD